MNEQINKRRMKWQIDFDNFFDVFNTFIIDGYIDDIQPQIKDDGSVKYVSITDYFIKTFYDNRETDKKCVIIYDPTESEDKKFIIATPFDEKIDEENSSSENGNEEIKYVRTYRDELSQHFWDILHQDELEEKMIFHNAGGPSLDLARIHYAITEQTRMSQNELINAFKNFWEIFSHSETKVRGYIFIIKMTSRLLTQSGLANGSNSNGLNVDELLIFRQLLNISQSIDGTTGMKLIVLANKSTDLPMWFTDESANPFIKKLTIDKPSEENKKAFFDSMIQNESFGEEFNRKYYEQINKRSDEDQSDTETVMEKKIKKKFLAYTNDFTMKMLKYYQKYVENGNTIDTPDKLGFSISTFKAGTLQNPWEDEKKLKEILQITNIVKRKIKGQDDALDAIQNILTRAAIGLDRIDNPNAPRVVLFLAGPTGVGKTEVCKQLAEAIFGSEERMVRFDMSEYGQEHSDQKLFGAPPGYVGYEEGGKLTNAMKKEPFSLVLFDEIEKAHGSILDKFLQILGDGRLTDGHGDTVSFTDAIIVITSNAGVTSPTPLNDIQRADIDKKMGNEPKPSQEMNMKKVIEMEQQGLDSKTIYNSVKDYLRYNIKYYFCCQLNRPELYGRIEDCIVYYNYIGQDAVHLISDAKIDAISATAKDDFKLQNIECSEEIKRKIAEHCQSEHIRSMGARGIGKAVNVVYNGSLSNFLSNYVTGKNGKQKSDLEGKSIFCFIVNKDQPISKDNLDWGIINE